MPGMMRLSPRQLVLVVTSGVFAALAVVWIASAVQSDNTTDGSFVLVEPGEFVEPTGTTVPLDGSAVFGRTGLEDLDGRPVDLEIYRGGPFVVNVWYSTCAPCAAELKWFAEAHAKYSDSVAFVGVDPFDGAETMQRFAEERQVGYDLLLDPTHEFVDGLGISAYPTTMFFDADGVLLRQTTTISADELDSALRELYGVEA